MQIKHNYLVQSPAYTVACSHTSNCVTLLLEPILQQDTYTRTQTTTHINRHTHTHGLIRNEPTSTRPPGQSPATKRHHNCVSLIASFTNHPQVTLNLTSIFLSTYPVSNAATQGSARDATGFGTQSSPYQYQYQHIPTNGNFDVSFAGSQFAQ